MRQSKKILGDSAGKFIEENFDTWTNQQFAEKFNVDIHTVRVKCYELGLYRMRLEYWTQPQINYLVRHYKKIGDSELATLYNEKWPKEKGWTLKHIEKKRMYLGLKRTTAELAAIRQRNVDNGCFLLCPVKRWDACGRAKEKEVRFWREASGRFIPRIKIRGKFVFWARWKWEQHRGKIPQGMNVVFKDNNPRNMKLRNLLLVTDAELSARNSKKSSQGLSDNYVAGMLSHKDPDLRKELLKKPDLLGIKRTQLLINRKIKEHGQ